MAPGKKSSGTKGRDKRRLTPRQLQILTRIRDYRRSHGYSPSMQELADDLQISKVTVFEHVDTLVAKGQLYRNPHKARSLELTSQAQLPDDRPTLLPLMGRIAAGLPIEAIENADALDLESIFASRADTFVLRVTGNSMIDEQIRDQENGCPYEHRPLHHRVIANSDRLVGQPAKSGPAKDLLDDDRSSE